MAQKNVEGTPIEELGTTAMTKTELFFEEKGKQITLAIFALFIIAAAIFGYKALVVDPTEGKAADAMYIAQTRIEGAAPDYQLALNGDAASEGFLSVIQNYGSTKTGNIAKHYAGICYLKLGDKENALKYLKMYKAQDGVPAQLINAQNLGLQGDIAVNNKDYTTAVTLFTKASEVSENALTTPMYMCKAGIAAKAAGDTAKAIDIFTNVVQLYPSSIEANTASKYLGMLK